MLLVGGETDIYLCRCAEILCQSNDGNSVTWRWRTIASMRNRRINPGVLKLDHLGDANVQKVLIAGGRTDTAEILTISCSDEADLGQWTLIETLNRKFECTYLATTSSRILVFGEPFRQVFVS